MRRATLLFVGILFAAASFAGELTAEQHRVCEVYAQLGEQMAKLRMQGVSYQDQMERNRKMVGSEGMEEIKRMLDFVYSPRGINGEPPESYGRAFSTFCEARYIMAKTPK